MRGIEMAEKMEAHVGPGSSHGGARPKEKSSLKLDTSDKEKHRCSKKHHRKAKYDNKVNCICGENTQFHSIPHTERPAYQNGNTPTDMADAQVLSTETESRNLPRNELHNNSFQRKNDTPSFSHVNSSKSNQTLNRRTDVNNKLGDQIHMVELLNDHSKLKCTEELLVQNGDIKAKGRDTMMEKWRRSGLALRKYLLGKFGFRKNGHKRTAAKERSDTVKNSDAFLCMENNEGAQNENLQLVEFGNRTKPVRSCAFSSSSSQSDELASPKKNDKNGIVKQLHKHDKRKFFERHSKKDKKSKSNIKNKLKLSSVSSDSTITDTSSMCEESLYVAKVTNRKTGTEILDIDHNLEMEDLGQRFLINDASDVIRHDTKMGKSAEQFGGTNRNFTLLDREHSDTSADEDYVSNRSEERHVKPEQYHISTRSSSQADTNQSFQSAPSSHQGLSAGSSQVLSTLHFAIPYLPYRFRQRESVDDQHRTRNINRFNRRSTNALSESRQMSLGLGETTCDDPSGGGTNRMLSDLVNTVNTPDTAPIGLCESISGIRTQSGDEEHARSECSSDDQKKTFHSSSSCMTPSSKSSDSGEADDEFECECEHCQYLRRHAHTGQQQVVRETSPPRSNPSLRALLISPHRAPGDNRDYSSRTDMDWLRTPDDLDLESGIFSIRILELTPLDYMITTESRDILDVMFENVILQMLAVYPDLLGEQAPPPASKAAIDALPTRIASAEDIEQNVSCPICLCPWELQEVMSKLPCRHLFHPLCIKAWLAKSGTCPVCRQTV
ncbi:hypothetical protein CHS0354_003431 [Potamilus streckersoni]|uniref:RING-type domain-containing protein n=1 Tax=Potamilus streckersoni TaxID=2493646 RepID=A0AAE0SPG7_9BIVA|nr:hypothetical protein CHS0354_003431 [Potamilus streckersoni]